MKHTSLSSPFKPRAKLPAKPTLSAAAGKGAIMARKQLFRKFAASAALAITMALAACGGGGGGDPATDVSITPPVRATSGGNPQTPPEGGSPSSGTTNTSPTTGTGSTPATPAAAFTLPNDVLFVALTSDDNGIGVPIASSVVRVVFKDGTVTKIAAKNLFGGQFLRWQLSNKLGANGGWVVTGHGTSIAGTWEFGTSSAKVVYSSSMEDTADFLTGKISSWAYGPSGDCNVIPGTDLCVGASETVTVNGKAVYLPTVVSALGASLITK